MKMPFTPEPWKLFADDCHYDSLTEIIAGYDPNSKNPKHKMIVEVGGHANIIELEANALLISLAPKMYNLIKDIKEKVLSHCYMTSERQPELESRCEEILNLFNNE